MRPVRKRTKRMKVPRTTMPGRSCRCWIRTRMMRSKRRQREPGAML